MISMSIGLILSGIMIRCSISVPVSYALVLVVIVSVIMNKIDNKLTCLSYVIACIYIVDWILVQFDLKNHFFDLGYNEMIYLVGILHVIEGGLTFIMGGKKSQAVMTYRGNRAAGGYEAYGKWLIPLLFFSINGIYIPIIAAVVYCNESFVMSPKEKAKIMGILIGSFGVIVILLARLVQLKMLPLELGILCMPLLHELLFKADASIEKGPLKYPYPREGLRIMEAAEDNSLGLGNGEVLKHINDIVIHNEESYLEQLLTEGKVVIEVENLSGERRQIVTTSSELKKIKMVFLPPY